MTDSLQDTFETFMERLKEAGYTRVAFSCYDPEIPSSSLRGIYALQPLLYYKGYVYVYPTIPVEGRPAIWGIVSDLQIGACGGSTDCYGLKDGFANYVGSYSYRLVDGVWTRLPRKYDDPVLMAYINRAHTSKLTRTAILGELSDDYDVEVVVKVKGLCDVMYEDLSQMPLYINDYYKKNIAIHRLKGGLTYVPTDISVPQG